MKKLILIIAGCMTSMISVFGNEVVKVACVGDSITAGVGAKNRKAQNYPAQLQALLGDKYTVKNFGVSGIQTQNYFQSREGALKKRVVDFQPDIIVIKLGTNDTKSRKLEDPADKAEFKSKVMGAYLAMVEAFENLESKPELYVCTPVPVFKTMGAIREQVLVEDVLPIVQEVSRKTGAPIIDLYAALTGKGDMVPDGVHPNEKGYEVIANAVARVVKDMP